MERIDLGDLPAGRPVWVAGRVPRGEATEFVFRVTTAKGQQIAASKQATLPDGDVCSALKALFGARRICGLEFLIHSGYTGDELAEPLRHLGYDLKTILEAGGKSPKVYAENAREKANAVLRDLLVRESLDYGLVSSQTAFIAVRSEAGKPIEETVVVANALPAGWATGPVASGPIMYRVGRTAVGSAFLGMFNTLASLQVTASAFFDTSASVRAVAPSAAAMQPRTKSTIVFSGARSSMEPRRRFSIRTRIKSLPLFRPHNVRPPRSSLSRRIAGFQ